MNHDRIPAELTLVNGADTITVRPLFPAGPNPIHCKTWDLGAPEYRYTTVANPGTDGTTYSDGFVGARTVTFELAIMGDNNPDHTATHDAYWYANKLTAMTHPQARPTLHITRADETTAGITYKMDLRGSPYNLPYTRRSAALLEMQLVFTCPLGLIESDLYNIGPTTPLPGTTLFDWVFPAKFDKTFGIINARFPQAIFTIGADTAVAPTIYINGPCTDPEIISDNTDRFRFTGLTLETGQTVQIDMASGSVRLGTTETGTILDDMTVYNTVDWAVSTFWRWPPGQHTVTYIATSGSMQIQYRERRINI